MTASCTRANRGRSRRPAFETMNRSNGKWISRISHRMMVSHVIHYFFFERVPHYRLQKETEALIEGLNSEEHGRMYKRIETKSFTSIQ
jgi:hypothetical protein